MAGLVHRTGRPTGRLIRASTLLLLVATLAAGARSEVSATTYRVPEVIPTIASANSAATKGDTILISPGTHIEPSWVNLRSGVRLIGDGTWETVTVDFEGITILPLSSGEPVATIVEGIGFESVEGPEPKFEIMGNPLAVVQRNRFLTNGAIRFLGGGRFEHNIVIMTDPSSGRFTIEGAPSGAGIPGHLTIARNTISLSQGGFTFAAQGWIKDLDFDHNTVVYPLWDGGGFPTFLSGWDYGGGEYRISSNIFWGVQLACSDYNGIGGTIEFTSNCFDTWIPDPTFPCPPPAAGTGNLVGDPLFCEFGEPWLGTFDWRLQPQSPCIGAGEGGTNIGSLGTGCEFVGVPGGEASPDPLSIVAFPTPTTGVVNIRLESEHALTGLFVFDALGALVVRLDVGGSASGTGRILHWDGTMVTGDKAPSGMYFVRAIDINADVWTTRVVLMR